MATLQTHGVDAISCAQRYEIARLNAHRGTGEKLETLYDFWAADLHSQVLRQLAGVSTGQ